jgi:tight adherence protein B
MLLPALVFLLVAGIVLGGYAAMTQLPSKMAARRLEKRLREVSQPGVDEPDSTVVMARAHGPLPVLDRLVGATSRGASLARLIEQSGVRTTPSAVAIVSVCLALAAGLSVALVVPYPAVALAAASAGVAAPFGWLAHRRSSRLKRFEEQFPEALDLLSRAIRAGHAFQTAMGMVGEELPAPVGSEFKKTFDRQNFRLPLRDAMDEMADRVPILDVRFFVTAVAIQRETGGNLAEILDNLAHVVRERFKIRRQVRVHTAHGRFTGYVLLALPAALAVALSFISPDHMKLLFQERMGQLMVMGAIVMQTVGFIWIRQVIKIEV